MEVARRGEQLVFRYRLVDGTIDNSYASYTALRAGLPTAIVERGYDLYIALRHGRAIVAMTPKSNDIVTADAADNELAQRSVHSEHMCVCRTYTLP
jgi:DNA mismatch repair ATPase MutS